MNTRFLIFTLLFFSCKNNDSTGPQFVINDTSTTFKTEIPTYPSGKIFYPYTAVKRYEKDLNLDSIDGGFDGLQIRVWYSSYSGENLLVITNKNTTWTATAYDLRESDNTDSIKVYVVEIKHPIPKSGWFYFAKKLADVQIVTIPQMRYGSVLPTDGECVNVEIATKNSYRFYSICDPDAFEEDFIEAKKMVVVLKLLKEELGFDKKPEVRPNNSK